MISDDPAQRWYAYTAAHIRIWHPSGALHVEPRPDGSVTGAFPDTGGATVHLLTADNPGHEVPEEQNARGHARLGRWLAERPDLVVWTAEGGDASWTHRERSFAVVGLTDDEARALGQEFDQEAVFAWRPDALVVLSCDGTTAAVVGWSLSRRPPVPPTRPG